MTAEQIEQWKVERDIARASGDPELERRANDHKDEMMMTCISHQSARTKKLVEEVDGIKTELKPCIESNLAYRAEQEQRKGAWKLVKVLKYLASAGAGGLVYKLVCG